MASLDRPYNIQKVYSSFWMRENLLDEICHKLSVDFHGNGNDSYFAWQVSGVEEGAGWITTEQEQALDKWLLAHGAEAGEEVIIGHGW